MIKRLLNRLSLIRVIAILVITLILPQMTLAQATHTFNFFGCAPEGETGDNTSWFLYDDWRYICTDNSSAVSNNEAGGVNISLRNGDGISVLYPVNEEIKNDMITKVSLNCSIIDSTTGSTIYVRAANRNDSTNHYSESYKMSMNGNLEINLNNSNGIRAEKLGLQVYSDDNKAFSLNLKSITLTYIISELPKPTFFSKNSGHFGLEYEPIEGATCYYHIDYYHTSKQDKDGTYNQGENISFEAPCTITAYLQLGDMTSETVRAKYFGFDTENVNTTYNTESDMPEVVPDGLPSTIEIEYQVDSDDFTFTENGKKVTPKKMVSSNGYPINGAIFKLQDGTGNLPFTILNTKTESGDNRYDLGSLRLFVDAKPLTKNMIQYTAEETFTNESAVPNIVITDGDYELKENEIQSETGETIGDYDISFKRVNGETTQSVEDMIEVGNYIITVKGNGNYTGEVYLPFTINPITITQATISLSQTEFNYDGTQQLPTITQIIAIDSFEQEQELSEGDYNTTYKKGDTDIEQDNIINAGEYQVVVTFKGKYSGSFSQSFTIHPKSLNGAIMTISASSFSYNGDTQNAQPTVKFSANAATGSNETILTNDDYDLSYKMKNGDIWTDIAQESIINVGTYKVIATGKGNYTDSKESTFTITPASASISAGNQTVPYTGSEIEFDKSKISVEPASLSSSITTTYYATNPDDSQANTPSPMASAPKNIGQYWVVIGLSNANYQASQTATLTIQPPKPTITPEGGQQRYDTTITLAKPYDVPGADIYYSWNNGADSTIYEAPINVETGNLKAWMIVEYMGVDVAGGKYKGEIATAAFTRQEDPALSFIGQDNKTIETAEYTIGASDQSLPTLKNTHNVTVSFESSNSQVATINDGVVTPVGVGTTTITASSPATEGYIASNVSYTLTVYKSLSHESISITVADATYNGEPQTPTITVKDGETTLTKAETSDGTGDYTVVYSNNTLAAASTDDVAPTATITGKGNYKGEVSRTFTISTATMTITAEGYNGTYDGNAHGITVVAPEGATVTYGTKKGTYDKTESPTYTDAGSYMVHYQVVKTNYATITDSAKVEITKATPSITFDKESYSATYGPEGLTVTATSSSNTQVATVADGAISIIGIGETTITVSFAGNNNYEAATTTYKLNVAAGAITGITATGYTGTYDGNSHGITVTAPEGATVTYGTKKGTYDKSESPTYTDAGSYMVHYQVERTNYATITDSAKVEITKATPSITFDKESYSATYGIHCTYSKY